MVNALERFRPHPPRALGALMLSLWTFLAWNSAAPMLGERALVRALPVGLVALAVSAAFTPLARWTRRALLAGPDGLFVSVCALGSAALATWFFRSPMHGQVMARDACVYVLQGRALSHLSFGIPVALPRIASSVHFLFEGADGRFHGVFAPGYPLFLAGFIALGALSWAPGFTAALLTLAQCALCRAVTRDPFVLRLSLLLAMPSFARAVETADLLSHAFVGALAAFALALALTLPARPSMPRALALGVCVGWTFSSRMLDGLVLIAAVSLLLAPALLTRRLALRFALVAALVSAPFAGFVALQQHVATGSFRTPTAVAYARRADYPPTCLRLGFGPDVGCVVEHTSERASFGADGFTPDDALRVIRERTQELGPDLVGSSALLLLAFVALLLAPTREALVVGGFSLGYTLAYGMFYYGNAVIYGARHIFPIEPGLVVLMAWCVASLPARASGRFDREHVQGVAVLVFIALFAVLHPPRWAEGLAMTRGLQGQRANVRELINARRVARGVIASVDIHSYLAALDPWRDAPRRMLVLDDRAGLLDVRRHHPDLPLYAVIPGHPLYQVRSPVPPPGIALEMERAWPALARPHGLGTAVFYTPGCCHLPSSGEHVLLLFEAQPGDSLSVPFDVAQEGDYALHMEGFSSLDYGDWALALDGRPLPPWHGYSPAMAVMHGEPSAPMHVTRGAHTFSARSTGRDPRSRGYEGAFDVLVGERVLEGR